MGAEEHSGGAGRPGRGERLERMRRSPQFHDGVFRNSLPGAVAPSMESAPPSC
ncbi:hypothetical protein ACFQX6_18035 [Streptosporangium lutulentum]